jgi:integral membrane sensor domain MASE1
MKNGEGITMAKGVWKIHDGEVRKPGLSHFVMTALFTGIGVVVGTFGSLAIPLGYVTAFWPGQAIQSVGCIWYGAWGGIASFIFPIISNAISGAAPLPVSLAYIPGNLAQGLIVGWAFRQFGNDPRLMKAADWISFTFWGAIVSNIIGAGWGSTVLRCFRLITPDAHLTVFVGWAIGNAVASWILGVIMLKFVSPIVMKTKTFCKGYWA